MRPSTALPRQTKPLRPWRKTVTALLPGALCVLAAVSLCFGSYPLRLFDPAADTWMAGRVFWQLRLPRVLAGILAGGVLGVTGGVCQTVFCNPLASPDITGVASGASLGAAAAILIGLTDFARIGFAFLGGMAALGALLLFVRLSRRAGAELRSRYVLAGILVSAAADAGVMILKTAADPERELAAIEFWTMGSFAALTADKLLLMAAAALPPLVLLLAFSGQATILSRGSRQAAAVGLSPVLWQMVLLTLVTWAVAGVVSTVGVIGFVGLIVPHIVLALRSKRDKGFFLLCFTVGAFLTVLSDLFARTAAPGSELPVSIFCIGFAVLWFVLLFCSGRVMGGDRGC